VIERQSVMEVSGWQDENEDWSLYQRQRKYGHEHGDPQVSAPDRNMRGKKLQPSRASEQASRQHGARMHPRDPERVDVRREEMHVREDRDVTDYVREGELNGVRESGRRRNIYNPGKYVRLSPKSYYEEQLFASKPAQQAKFPIVFKREDKKPRSIHVYRKSKRVPPSAQPRRVLADVREEEVKPQVQVRVRSEQVDDVVLQQLQVDRYGNKLTRRLGVPHRLSSLNESSAFRAESEQGENEMQRNVSYMYETEMSRQVSGMSNHGSESPQIYYDPLKYSKQSLLQIEQGNLVRDVLSPQRAIERHDERQRSRMSAKWQPEDNEPFPAYHVKVHNMQQMYRRAPPHLQPFSDISPDIRASPSSQYVTYVALQGQPQQRPYLPPIPPNPMHERQYHMPYDPAPRSRHQARTSFPLQEEPVRRGFESSVRRSVNTREEMKDLLARKMMESSTDFINAGFGRPGGGAPLRGGNMYGVRSSEPNEHEKSMRHAEHVRQETNGRSEQSGFVASGGEADEEKERAQRRQEELKRAWSEQIEEKRRRKEEEKRALELWALLCPCCSA